jgi:GNAT superfamily N-acetyltransferase
MKKHTISVRKGAKKDKEVVLQILKESWHSGFAGTLDCLWRTETEGRTAEELSDYLDGKLPEYPHPQTWLAFCDGKPAGALSCGTHRGRFWLWEIFVKHKYRGLGIGERLVGAALKDCTHKVYLDVNIRNPAVKFWRKMGFRPVVRSMVMVRE